MMPWTTALRRVVGTKQTWLDDILCSAVSTERIRDAGRQVSELLHERHHITPETEDDFNIRHPEDLLRARLETAKTLQHMLLALALLSLAVGGIGIMNVMLASVTQRTREIGVRVAIGATPSAIQLQFLGEAVLLTTIGGGLGVALGTLGSSFVSRTLGWELARCRCALTCWHSCSRRWSACASAFTRRCVRRISIRSRRCGSSSAFVRGRPDPVDRGAPCRRP